MKPDNNTVNFQIDGLFKLNKVGDYLKLVEKKVKLVFRKTDSGLGTKTICKANVAALSDTGTHLVLKKVCIKRFFFFSRHIEKYSVPIDNIASVQVLDKYGKID